MKGQPRRVWTAARAKIEREGTCRAAEPDPCDGPLECAHIVGREHDGEDPPGEHIQIFFHPRLYVHPVRIVPLCRVHHRRFDAHELDVFWWLDEYEIAQAIRDAGSPSLMLKRTAPLAYKRINGVAV